MGRDNRRFDGDPHYPLVEVIRAAGVRLIEFTKKAIDLEAPRIMPDVLNRREEIRRLVQQLTREQWVFEEEKNGGYVDVYRIRYGPRDVWLKIKLEPQQHAKKIVLVISFHEFDNDRPI